MKAKIWQVEFRLSTLGDGLDSLMRLGLRAKSALALSVCVAVVLLVAALAGWRAFRAVEENLGAAFARNSTQLNKQRLLTPISRELALSQRLAGSELTRRWLRDEDDPAKRALFFVEAERYRRAFSDGSYFVASGLSNHYYFNDQKTEVSTQPRFTLNRDDPAETWFFSTLRNTKDFNLNVDPNVKRNVTKVWINVLVKDKGQTIGVVGSGLDLTQFLERFIKNAEAGVTPMILNPQGAIQAHPDPKLIDFGSINEKSASNAHRSVFFDLLTSADQAAARRALERSLRAPDEIQLFEANLNGQSNLFAVSYLPELKWHVVTAVDLSAARVVDKNLWTAPLLVGVLLLLLLMLAVGLAVNRVVLTPLLRLLKSVRSMEAGNYNVQLPQASRDEFGELTTAFSSMAAQVRSYTDELESKVEERTRELVAVNERIRAANRQINDSITYASRIQDSILPRRELADFPGEFFAWWRPRDVVGGDFYLFEITGRDENGGENGAVEECVWGVVDCAGHGVPGAFVTMMAHSAFRLALDELGPHDPAAVLARVDSHLRASLQNSRGQSVELATNMDAALIFADLKSQTLVWSGAKIDLFWSDGQIVDQFKGGRSVLGGKRVPVLENQTLPLRTDGTYFVTTDGFLDQAGGPKGFSFGDSRFRELLEQNAELSLDEQEAAFRAALERYQGERVQRDDITLLGFRFHDSRFHDSRFHDLHFDDHGSHRPLLVARDV